MAKVVSRFRDKDTKKLYEKGDSYTHKDEKRVAFLVEQGFLEAEEPKKPAAKKPAAKKEKKDDA